MRKGWGIWVCLAWRREGSFEILSALINISRTRVRRMEPGSSQWCSATGKGQWGQTGTQEAPSEEKFWRWQNMKTGSPERLWSLLHGNILNKPDRMWYCATCSRWMPSSRGLDQMISRSSFQPLPFCDSVILRLVQEVTRQTYVKISLLYSFHQERFTGLISG